MVGALALVAVLGWYLTFSATRLDRLHARLEGARSALDAQLVRRASVALQIAGSGRLDPATALLLADAAHEAREVDSSPAADPTAREMAESNLTGALLAAFAEPSVARRYLTWSSSSFAISRAYRLIEAVWKSTIRPPMTGPRSPVPVVIASGRPRPKTAYE